MKDNDLRFLIDQVCDKFESAWQRGQGQRTTVESILEELYHELSKNPTQYDEDGSTDRELNSETWDSFRNQALHDLLSLEIWYRCQQGDEIDWDSIVVRFPDDHAVIQSVKKGSEQNTKGSGPFDVSRQPSEFPPFQLKSELAWISHTAEKKKRNQAVLQQFHW